MLKQNNYIKMIKSIKNMDEMNELKNNFLNECKKHENKIAVSNILHDIDNFCSAKTIFETLAPSLMSKKNGKNIINKYVNIIKENKSLKTIYAYYEGLKYNETPETKKNYIIEALSISKPISYDEYVKGIGDIISVISESFKLLGDDYILENVKHDVNSSIINESLLYLSTTKKNINNLNEYISHLNKVTNNINENKTNDINVNLSLEEIVSEMNTKISTSNIDNIFTTENKEVSFKECKDICLEMIKKQKNNTTDNEIISKLLEMETKLLKKQYVYETFTKDMIYMKELQEVLK